MTEFLTTPQNRRIAYQRVQGGGGVVDAHDDRCAGGRRCASHDHRRTVRVREQVAAHRTHEQAPDERAPVRSHDDERRLVPGVRDVQVDDG